MAFFFFGNSSIETLKLYVHSINNENYGFNCNIDINQSFDL